MGVPDLGNNVDDVLSELVGNLWQIVDLQPVAHVLRNDDLVK
jgi:hypothetical protein